MIRLLFEVGHLYHRAALDPLYQVFREDPQYHIAFPRMLHVTTAQVLAAAQHMWKGEEAPDDQAAF